ncbi:MAG: hypothetical protein DBX55_04150 [Verrucomicrobia bacterium]|nr:MAG: hypothetical protein DBX55_04150 [Verrucomicrobiota bacterium]
MRARVCPAERAGGRAVGRPAESRRRAARTVSADAGKKRHIGKRRPGGMRGAFLFAAHSASRQRIKLSKKRPPNLISLD